MEPSEPTEEEIKAEPMLQLFKFKHLKDELRAVSCNFCQLARQVVATLPRNPERTVSIRKLREAKDCAVTAFLWKQPS